MVNKTASRNKSQKLDSTKLTEELQLTRTPNKMAKPKLERIRLVGKQSFQVSMFWASICCLVASNLLHQFDIIQDAPHESTSTQVKRLASFGFASVSAGSVSASQSLSPSPSIEGK